MLIIEGPQGCDKSTAVAVLAVREEWYSNYLPLNSDPQKTIERTSGFWIVEAGELQGMTRNGKAALKNFLSSRKDTSRMVWGRFATARLRQFIIIGTTNDPVYLQDSTGNRRYWPVRVGRVDIGRLREERDQLWAEAAHREAMGMSIRLDPSLYTAAAAEQEQRQVPDPYVEELDKWLGDKAGAIASVDVWRILGVPTERRNNSALGESMQALGWKRKQLRLDGPPVGVYYKGMERSAVRAVTLEVEADHAGRCKDVRCVGEPPPF